MPAPWLLHPCARWMVAACAALALLAGCGTAPRGPASISGADGALPNPPPDLDKVPDAEPRVEPIRAGGANKPYEVDGRRYEPLTTDAPLRERGLASWYGRKFHGRATSIGERYDMYAMTAAHPTMPLPSYARVTNVASGRTVVVRVNDRGPFHPGRVIDLSYTAALRLGLLRGVGIVEVERITNEDIRTGAWKRDDATALAAVRAEPVEAARAAPAAPAPSAAPTTGYWVQLGAFRQRAGAESFQQQVAAELAWIAPLLAVFDEPALHRLQAGPYASRGEASGVAERLRAALSLVPVIVERPLAALQ
ncbi:MAG TPA: septal ring lytic transglycosylase RlpA family protein [Ideonella sp.]|nr:septal ring lytic transglycosylase RlpA family protein [Ideonella sp.]